MINKTKEKLILIGMPGSGKTTIGKLLAQEYNCSFCDMDDYISQISQKSIAELFSKGEDIFRDYETQACRELSISDKTVISTGGGVIKKDINMEILKETGIIIFIDRPVQKILEDININSRPLLKNGKDRLHNLYNERINLYKKFSDIEILNDKSLNNAVYNITNIISENFKFKFKEK
ncbi:shikimate kinase [Clostridioides sp. ES-S-0077-01]|uniref:shikimate kinase n=1 Tax=Clostridioides sp. ES-S-0077-01 TaxID=2770782 RepID=UPI001D12BAAF|nr:shikimate kinase [Clostridioides sp. ES-S-0077-01]